MAVTGSPTTDQPLQQHRDYDREAELKAFDDSKAGVKGIADLWPTKIPRIFINHDLNLHKNNRAGLNKESIPIISLKVRSTDPAM